MWFGFMWWWLIPLGLFLAMRGHHRRRWARERSWRTESEAVAELRQVVESQRSYIDELEGRLTRVEDGLEFAERLLAERGAPA
jgi:hypothetical protein